jgi:glycosyltransferase 2 family protein
MRRTVEAIALTAGIGALSLLCWHFGLGELAAAFGRLTPAYLGAYLICGCAARLGYGLRWQAVARSLDERPDLARLVGARIAADAVGSVLPTGRIGGDPVRVALVYGESASGSRAAAGVAIDRIIEVISNTICAIAYVATFSYAHAAAPSYQAQTLLVTMSALLVLLAIPLATLRRGSSPFAPLYGLVARRSATWAAALRRIEAHLISFFRDHPGTLVRALLGSLVIEGFMVGEFFFLLAAFGLTLDLPTLLMALVAGGVARAVPTPGGLGAVEASQVGVLAFAAGRPDIGFVIGIVLRLHETFWIAIGLVAFSLQGSSLARLRLLVAARKSAV